MARTCRSVLLWVLCCGVLLSGPVSAEETRIYLVRHAETEGIHDPRRNLSESGRVRAQALARRLADLEFDYVFSSHTLRSRNTVAPTAEAGGLEVQQFPAPGSESDGELVDYGTATEVAIRPLLAALKSVPAGSTVLVGGNSGNLFAIMAGLGVCVATEVDPCIEDVSSCVPCEDRSCFPMKQHDNLWLVIPAARPSDYASMKRWKYGD